MRVIVIMFLLAVFVGTNLGVALDWHFDDGSAQLAQQDDRGGTASDHDCHSSFHFVGALAAATERFRAPASSDLPKPTPSFRNLVRSPPVPPPSLIV